MSHNNELLKILHKLHNSLSKNGIIVIVDRYKNDNRSNLINEIFSLTLSIIVGNSTLRNFKSYINLVNSSGFSIIKTFDGI